MNERDFWRYLHDGMIERVDGAVPGDVAVRVSILYVRERFPGDGDGFDIVLTGCTCFEYAPYDEPACSDLASIAALGVELVSLDRDSAAPIVVHCAMGTLRLDYASARIALDTGEPVTLQQLEAAFAGYWDEWEQRRSS